MPAYNTEHLPVDVVDQGGPDFPYRYSPELSYAVVTACGETAAIRYAQRYRPAANRKMCKQCAALNPTPIAWDQVWPIMQSLRTTEDQEKPKRPPDL